MSHIRPKSLSQWICYAVALFCFVQAGRAVLVPTDTPVVQAAITPTPRYIEVPIEQVRAGDLVVSRNDRTGELVSQPVAQAFSRISNHLRLVETENLSTGERQVIETTNEHPFWVTDLGWVNAGELQPGQTLEDVTGQAVVVLATRYEPHAEGVPVFNFEVTDTHTYFVKAPTARGPPIWVHNATCGEVLVQLADDYHAAAGLNARQLAHAHDLEAIRGTVNRLGEGALRRSGGDWRKSEALFEQYLGALDRRLVRASSPYRVEFQVAARVGEGRVPGFIQEVFSNGTFGRIEPFPGSRRLDAAIVNATALEAGPYGGRYHPVLLGADITLNVNKRNIVPYYQEAFGTHVPILDIR